MDNTQVTKRKIGALIAKNLIVMLVAVIVALTGVLAWFAGITSADASGVSVECRTPDGIEIAVVAKGEKPENSDFHKTSITLENQAFMQDLSLSEVTSDGISFYRPVLNQLGGTAIPDPSKEWEEEDAIINKSYLSFDLYIRSESEQENIFLKNSSKFTTVSNTLIGADADNKSSLGDFSRDCIVGATRLSVVGYKTDKTAERKLLWIPRPELKFYIGDNTNTSNVDDNQPADSTSYQHKYWAVTKSAGVQVRPDNPTIMDPEFVTTSQKINEEYVLGTDTSITSLSTPQTFVDEVDGTNKTYYCNHVTVNIWIEGEDDEARLALVNGEFKINLDLSLR